MENANTELSGKTPALISWLQVIGLIIFIASQVFLRHLTWLLYAGFGLILIAYLLRMYFDWKHGRKKAFRNRLLFLVLAIIAGLVVGYFASKRG